MKRNRMTAQDIANALLNLRDSGGNFDDLRQVRSRYQTLPVAHDLDAPLRSAYPHYTDSRFREYDQTLFLDMRFTLDFSKRYPTLSDAQYQYSDHLHRTELSHGAWDCAKAAEGEPNTARFFQTYLRLLFGKPNLELAHLMAGVNRGNGYPYQIFGYYPDGAPKE